MPGNGMKCVLILWISVSSCYGSCPLNCRCPGEKLVVDCSNATLTDFPPDIDLNKTILDLSQNRLKDVTVPSFQNLNEIDFSCNLIETAKFDSSPNLRKLNFSYNLISSTRNINILKLDNLKILDFTSNNITFPKSIASKSLEELYLSSNQIVHLEDGFIDHSPNLTKLIISNNKIKSLTGFNSKILETLDISGCSLGHLSKKNLQSLPKLKKLNAANNKELKLTLDGHCLHIEEADFSKTNTSDVLINSLCQIRHLNFAFNSISDIKIRTFSSNIYLNKLNLSFNNIVNINTESFINNNELHVFDISNNCITTVEWSKYLNDVRSFNVSNNKITSIDNLRLSKSEIIDLSKNNIQSLKDFSKNFPLVVTLNFHGNLIDHVPPLASETLKNLILSYCQISILIENTFIGLTKLEYLNLEGNKLKQINYKLFENVPSLQYVNLDHNTWSCFCDSKHFQDLMVYLLQNNTLTNQSCLHCDDDATLWTQKCLINFPTNQKGLLNIKVALGVGCFFLVAIASLAAIVYFKSRIFHSDEENSSPDTHIYPQRLLRSSSQTDTPRDSVNNDRESQLPPPSYEEALLMPPLTEIERITRSREVLNSS